MFSFKQKLAIVLFSVLPVFSFAQLNITGTVKSTTDELIPGATISIDNTYLVSQSKSDGSFEIKNLKAGKYVLRVSFIGYNKYADTLDILENKNLEIRLVESSVLMDEVIVSATRTDSKSAMAYSVVGKEQIAVQNAGQDLPYLLNTQTSVVTTSDAGAGVGYTGLKIRGSDATRTNVTINGIPVNDAESQGTYWVDLPDIASSIDNIQIQRGVGSSTNGAGAFGGSLNIETTKLNPDPYAEYSSSGGSFNTFKNTLNIGSGLINKKFAFDARLSRISSDGFVDRASSDLKSYYVSGAYYGKKDIVKFITFSGLETTYQAWNGIPEARLKGNADELQAYIDRNYLGEEDATNLINSGNRTYNQFTYHNQIDHYKQDYYQLHYSHEFSRKWNLNAALHYTKGKGYYEEYKKDQSFSRYGYDDVVTGSDTITTTDLVRRQWLDNNFYGTTYSLNYNSFKKINAAIGGAYNRYDGLHYGEIIWAEHAGNSMPGQQYYNDTAHKSDFNVFAKINYQLTSRFNLFGDMQYRMITYSFLGFDRNLVSIQQDASYTFYNPKFGVNYDLSANANIYASYSVGNKEPSRNDLTQSTPDSRPKAENLQDIEIGYKHKTKIAMWALNAYYMNYKNQLVLTGEINDVGAYNRTNVASSYREGIEAEFGIRIFKQLSWNANATFSQNKINNFKEYIDDYDNGGQVINEYKTSDIAFSPNLIAASTLTFEPVKNLKFNFISKYVDQQYLDNTSHDDRKLDAYFVNDVRINYSFKTKFVREVAFTFMANNIFSEAYESNGYTYGYIYGAQHIKENFYYPQAGINFLGGITVKF